jgi:hypothetical protein
MLVTGLALKVLVLPATSAVVTAEALAPVEQQQE